MTINNGCVSFSFVIIAVFISLLALRTAHSVSFPEIPFMRRGKNHILMPGLVSVFTGAVIVIGVGFFNTAAASAVIAIVSAM